MVKHCFDFLSVQCDYNSCNPPQKPPEKGPPALQILEQQDIIDYQSYDHYLFQLLKTRKTEEKAKEKIKLYYKEK